MHELAATPAQQDRLLLARIDPFASGSLETRLLYPRAAPQAISERIKLFFLKPLMKLAARNQVETFLCSDSIRGLEAASKLLTDIRNNPFRGVSENELSTVLAEAAMKGKSISGNFSKLIETHFRNPDNLERAVHQLLDPLPKTRQGALDSFMAFVRDPSAPLGRRDKRGIELLLGEIHAKTPSAALTGVLGDYLSRYVDAYDNAVKSNGFRDPTNKEDIAAACDELHVCFPFDGKDCIDVFEQFAGSGKFTDTNRSLLQRFLTLFAHHYAGLSRETIAVLLPAVIALEDAVEGKSRPESLSLPDDLQGDERKLATDLLLMVRDGSTYPSAAALALIEYMALKGRISTLQAEVARSERLRSGADEKKSSLFEKQKLAALRKGRTPPKRAKKTVLAYKGVWTSTTRGLEARRVELSGLMDRLVNPESRVRLAFVAGKPELLAQSLPLGDKSRRTAQRVLEALRKDLVDYSLARDRQHGPAAISPPAPASQSTAAGSRAEPISEAVLRPYR